MNIVVVGMGYVGIPVAALFADQPGFRVTGIQRRSERSGWKIDCINRGESPIGGNEPGLNELVNRVVNNGSLQVRDDFSACTNADAVILAVQTPVDEHKKPVYDSLIEAVEGVSENIVAGTLVSVESTLAPGTTINLVKPLLEEGSGLMAGVGFNLIYSYERVMAGSLLHNLINYPRIIGGYTQECAIRGFEFYKNIVNAEISVTDILTAEVSKVVENTYRDVNIAFANEVALICESLGVNVFEVRKYVNNLPFNPQNPSTNPYRNMHLPGAGVGGHCLPKDPWLLKYGLDNYGKKRFYPKILVDSRELNDSMPDHLIELTLEALNENYIQINDAKVALLGLSFREDVDDTRNSPCLKIYTKLVNMCREVIIHDPYIKECRNLPIHDNLYEAVFCANALILITSHEDYQKIDLNKIRGLMYSPIIVDGRNAFNSGELTRIGFVYKCVGKSNNYLV